ncbi:MAG: hydrogen peroxide-dependent heme synthase [Actinomycetota bacterium]|nr:hydrogen peroxide-dependent heme synthase [Actinomycetota bacterium]
MTDGLVFSSYPSFRVVPGNDTPKDLLAKEITELFEEFRDRVTVRGTYSTTGLDARTDLMFWWVADSVEDIQDLHVAFKRTALGRATEQVHAFLGVVRPAEFAKDHLPAFVKGEDPKKFLTVYPFVRTPEWYLLDPRERGTLLRDHGEAGREFPDVLANTTSAFGIGDYEWILAFEADGMDRIVDLIRRLRATEARRYTKVEIPFVSGIRKSVEDAVNDLP